MSVVQTLKRSDTLIGLAQDFRKLMRLPGRLSESWRKNCTIENYLASHHIKKLQLGAGSTLLDGWLSTDVAPTSDRIVQLDATDAFPFEDNTFDYVYSEHMIEHISWRAGVHMLRECRRVLKPSGTVRIATPDLAVLVGLYDRPSEPRNEKYIKWITDTFLSEVDVYKAPFVINNNVRNWGHQFLYDGEMMEMAMQEAGFTSIQRCALSESDDENLRGIETHGINIGDEEMVVFETMVYEAKCSA